MGRLDRLDIADLFEIVLVDFQNFAHIVDMAADIVDLVDIVADLVDIADLGMGMGMDAQVRKYDLADLADLDHTEVDRQLAILSLARLPFKKTLMICKNKE